MTYEEPQERSVVTESAGRKWTNRYHVSMLPQWTFAVAAKMAGAERPDGSLPYWWSGKSKPPAIGDRVRINFNGFGAGTVVAYLVEYGWLGIEVKCDKRPDWHIKQDVDNKHPHPMVFGLEID